MVNTTNLTMNLGYVLSESRKKVLVAEANMCLPTISSRLKLERSPGQSNLPAGGMHGISFKGKEMTASAWNITARASPAGQASVCGGRYGGDADVRACGVRRAIRVSGGWRGAALS